MLFTDHGSVSNESISYVNDNLHQQHQQHHHHHHFGTTTKFTNDGIAINVNNSGHHVASGQFQIPGGNVNVYAGHGTLGGGISIHW